MWGTVPGGFTASGSGRPERRERRPGEQSSMIGALPDTTRTGLFGSAIITTQTGTDQFAGEAVLGQSSGYIAGPSSC